ncbi:hypothetical protein Pyn_04195 [Prunus yedoensis var. nudiflora]|uniref:Uncharacterized protein n=1 Tax=Prunus yedoensis var. nudiflora TaxID=2094558 RepID=A0A314YKL1_PRUYE|nr:hypothetical protein Pyn_04195 [Prunus yedoensis var. nudiflora]
MHKVARLSKALYNQVEASCNVKPRQSENVLKLIGTCWPVFIVHLFVLIGLPDGIDARKTSMGRDGTVLQHLCLFLLWRDVYRTDETASIDAQLWDVFTYHLKQVLKYQIT